MNTHLIPNSQKCRKQTRYIIICEFTTLKNYENEDFFLNNRVMLVQMLTISKHFPKNFKFNFTIKMEKT